MSQNVSFEKSREAAEAARQSKWEGESFLKEIFLGNFQPHLLYPFPEAKRSPGFWTLYEELQKLLEETDSAQIDESGEYPPELIERLETLGAFGMKIPTEHGGLGFTQEEYSEIMKLLGGADANITVLLSAHQSIGAPQPIKLFGSKKLKNKYLRECARGHISAFALTEPDVGSDPARLTTTLHRVEGGYRLTGKKLWCTNGTFAKYLVVMARHKENDKISAVVVETDWEGVNVDHRCRFMGLKALQNGVISFENVFVPDENLIGKEGQGLKIALTTLNAGRLALPAGAAGIGKVVLQHLRKWCKERVQWGSPIGEHEAVAHQLADITTDTFVMDAISDAVSRWERDPNRDIRLEAAAAKEINTVVAWDVIDKGIQLRGGRGYESETSLKGRGEEGVPFERMMRDSRINRIIEGSSEIMHLFIAREAVDTHLQVAGKLIDPKLSVLQKIKPFLSAAWFYLKWYPSRWFSSGWFKYSPFGVNSFIDRYSRKLARSIFHGMLWYGPKMQLKQAFLFRCVDIALDLFILGVVKSKVDQMEDNFHPNEREARKILMLVFKKIKRRVKDSFRHLWSDSLDHRKYQLARSVMDNNYTWLEPGRPQA